MLKIQVLFITTTFLLLAATGISRADPLTTETTESETFAIEVSGQVPGFNQAQLSAYLTRKMQDETSPRWHFVEGVTGSENFPNRVVWLFKPLRKVIKS